MTIPRLPVRALRLFWKRRWALLFINLITGLFAAPYLYWTIILMPVVLRAEENTSILLWLNSLGALGGMLLMMLAMLGAGGSLSALRKMLRGTDGFLPGEFFSGLRQCAKTSLAAGAILGASLGIANVGLVNLYALQPAGILRSAAAAYCLVQLVAALALSLLALTQEDALQRHPIQALRAAGRVFAQAPLRIFGLIAASMLPLLLFFVWQQPLLTLLGFLFIALCAMIPIMLLWQRSCWLHKSRSQRSFLPLAAGVFIVLDAAVLLLPLLRKDIMPLSAMQASWQHTLDFISLQAAENDTLRNLLAASTVWPLLLAALLGSFCCIMTAFACACYRFRLRGLVFAAAVLLQILPMVFSFSSLEQLLRNLNLNIPSLALGLAWMLSYLLAAILLYNSFVRMLPRLEKNREQYPGIRLFFYYALRRVRLPSCILVVLVTLGCWNDALAPFWYQRELGAFSLISYIWDALSGWQEFVYCVLFFLGMLALLLLLMKRRSAPPKPRSPKPNAG